MEKGLATSAKEDTQTRKTERRNKIPSACLQVSISDEGDEVRSTELQNLVAPI